MAGVCGLVFLLVTVGLPLGNRFHKISRVGVAAQGQQSWHNSEEHIEGDNRPPLICWDSVCEGSAGMQRCSYMAPLGLEKKNSRIESTLCFYFPRNINNSKKIKNYSHLSDARRKEDGPVQHPAASRRFQTIDESN